MGILETEHSLNPTDLHHGHRRVYDPETFRAEFRAAGLTIDVSGGYWLKPLSNGQMESAGTAGPEMIDAFMRLGERYPDIAAEIYVDRVRLNEPASIPPQLSNRRASDRVRGLRRSRTSFWRQDRRGVQDRRPHVHRERRDGGKPCDRGARSPALGRCHA